MLRISLVLISICVFASASVLGEGTRELRPQQSDKGNLLLLQGYTMFGMYGASSKEQIKIRIASLSETIYFGFNNKNGKDAFGKFSDQGVFVPNIPYHILSPSGNVVYNGVMPDIGQEGNIPTWSQAVAGPKELGIAAGYDAIQFKPLETGDYVIEFNPAAQNISRLNIHLFDVTVTDATNKPLPGRLHSQGWQISTESYTNPFNGKVYPYDGNNAVYEVNFNGIQPWVFVINFNSKGTSDTGNFLIDRQSKIGNHTFGEYEVFLNPPDAQLYPVFPRQVSLEGSVEKKDCLASDFCLNFNTNSEGILEGFIDLNGNNHYDPSAGEIYFSRTIDQPGTSCVPWDGKDSFGNPVTGQFRVTATFGFGMIHLPLYDVEHNINGYKINVVRPAGATPPIIFWDDSQITAGSALDGMVNLTGCISAISGCHKWVNRGSINDNTALDKQETINTWWYSNLVYETKIYTAPATHHVQLSFDPASLVRGDTTVCRGDSLSFYVYNNGVHFNTSRYAYEWSFNNQALPGDIREQRQQIMQPSQVVVKATDRTYTSCISYDTLNIRVVDPVRLQSQVILPPCNGNTGSIEVVMTSGPPNKEFFWQEFPSEKTGNLTNLPRGTYHLIAMDKDYPACGADTSFVITELGGIAIDTVLTRGTLCYLASGEAEVFMKDPGKTYEYSWNNGPYVPSSVSTQLYAGSYRVIAREVGTGCTDERIFQIPALPIPFSVTTQNEICGNGQGKIILLLPSYDFDITWNGTTGKDTVLADLHAGSYSVTFTDPARPACNADTMLVISDYRYTIPADFDYTPAGSNMQGGQAGIQFINLSGNVSYSHWNFGDGNTSEEFSPIHHFDLYGTYDITLQVADANGCPGEVRKSFSPFKLFNGPCGIALPNVFSPNDDKTNDDIGILGYAPVVELKIFNRWGEVIFRTFEIEKRWNGVYRDEPSPVGVYPYILDWECPGSDGKMIHHTKVGDITLVR